MAIARSAFPAKSKYPTTPPNNPLLVGSSCSMISKARGLGAPDNVPAGNVARTTSTADTPSLRTPSTVETRCMIWLYRSTVINSVTFTELASQTFSRSFLARSTSIRCSAFSFASPSNSSASAVSASTSVPRGLDPAIGCSTAEPAFTRTNASGEEPTTEKGPSSSKKLSRYI